MRTKYHMAKMAYVTDEVINLPVTDDGEECCFSLVWVDLGEDREGAMLASERLMEAYVERRTDDDLLIFIVQEEASEDGPRFYVGPVVPIFEATTVKSEEAATIMALHCAEHLKGWARYTSEEGRSYATALPTFI